MVKELIYNIDSKINVETLLDKLEDKIDLKKASFDEALGYCLRDTTSTFELHVFPKREGEFYELNFRLKNKKNERFVKEIFGTPKKEFMKDASIMDIAEFIAELPLDKSENEIFELMKLKFNLSEKKYLSFKKLIIKQGSRINTRKYLKDAAKRLQ
ncbi:MAG: hypothetical protein JXA54_13225 [Candidatus Heimdallarchaeota archaeon]|nr:hypothetical protein [Candidatus Heimdallarchaeota archaeon]